MDQRAQMFLTIVSLDSLTMIDEGINVWKDHKSDLIEYLDRRVYYSSQEENSAKARFSSNEIARMLNSQRCWLFTCDELDTNPAARVVYYFPKMVEENMAYRLRKELGCCVENLTEKYIDIPQVTEEEYCKKLDEKFNKDDLQSILLDESKKFAQDVLLLLNI